MTGTKGGGPRQSDRSHIRPKSPTRFSSRRRSERELFASEVPFKSILCGSDYSCTIYVHFPTKAQQRENRPPRFRKNEGHVHDYTPEMLRCFCVFPTCCMCEVHPGRISSTYYPKYKWGLNAWLHINISWIFPLVSQSWISEKRPLKKRSTDGLTDWSHQPTKFNNAFVAFAFHALPAVTTDNHMSSGRRRGMSKRPS